MTAANCTSFGLGKMFIQNASKADVAAGNHKDPGTNSMLIQIADPAGTFPDPAYPFSTVHQFRFLDLEEKDSPEMDDFKITDIQAHLLVALLEAAKLEDMNVIVHCSAGICRSGAVTEVGVMMGFEDTGRHRTPNLLVKYKMMKALGWTYE